MRVNLLCTGLALIAVLTVVASNSRFHSKNKFHSRRIPRHRRNKSEKPNIVMVLTDDQDVLLGSLKVMPKMTKLIRNQGATFANSFSTTPMCCPSRSSILTGMYVHNHNVYTNNDNCSSVQWQQTHETKTFATYLSDKGYRTGYFGKYLNEYNGTYIPPGWREWVGLIRNSRYYNYSINFNGKRLKHGDNYYTDYLTDLIANDSVTFLKQSKQYYPNRPVLMVLSVPAPHGPEDAAPQYQHMFKNNTDHRTGSWNYAPNPDKQWLLQHTQTMAPVHIRFTDMLHRKRLQTLQSVDDLVEKVHNELKMLGELDNTYIIYTSDHGYHLGQFGLVKGKAMPYDFDIRIPMLIRGPGIPQRIEVKNVVANIDLAPTILDMAGVAIPEHMDGRSMLKVLKAAKETELQNGFVPTRKPWRDTVLIERGKVTRKQLQMMIREEKNMFVNKFNEDEGRKYNFYMTPRLRKLRDCSKKEFQPPCKPDQKWYCEKQPNGIHRRHKCRMENQIQSDQAVLCNCGPGKRRKMRKEERKNQRKFLKTHVSKNFDYKFLRSKRSVSGGSYDIGNDATVDLPSAVGFDVFDRRCRMLPNNTISCDRELYEDPEAWLDHKEKIEDIIKEFRKALEDLRDIRRHLKEKRPDEMSLYNELGLGGTLLSESINQEDDCDCEDDVIPSPKQTGRHEIKEERLRRRMMRKQRNKKRKRKKTNCNMPNMKCFTHDDYHWKTPPKWTSQRKGKRFNHEWCRKGGMECTLMDNHHWKTAPFWTWGPFCFCMNANNNTYWCLRTINATHDFLYCEFITKFFSFYNFTNDPDQLVNSVHELNFGVLQQLHEDLAELKACAGSKSCVVKSQQGTQDTKTKDILISTERNVLERSIRHKNKNPAKQFGLRSSRKRNSYLGE